MYTLDTNVIIYYLNRDKDAVQLLEEVITKRLPFYLSTVSEIELFSFPDLSDAEMTGIEEILQSISIISLDSRIARDAGQIRRSFKLSLADSAIAATALFMGTTLVTRNFRDFQKVTGLNVLKI